MIRIVVCIVLVTAPLSAEDRWIDARSTQSAIFKARQTRTLESFAGIAALSPRKLTRYGGLPAKGLSGSGFFRVEKIDGRWWMIDPEGGKFIFTGVCGLRRPSEPKVSVANAIDLLRAASFNGAGGFSDHDAIRAAERPLPYTITLNLMSGFGKRFGLTKAEPGHTGYEDDCIPVFEPDFERHCFEVCRERLAALKDDVWLVGVFSDNELPMPVDLLDRMLNRPGASQNAAEAFMAGRGVITDALREAFIEHVFDTYFRITTGAICKV